MENDQLIAIETICSHYKIETKFIQSLNEYGLIEITRVDQIECIDRDHLGDIETMMNMHYDLEINLEGIEAISHLLKKVREMQREITLLRNRID